MASHINPELPFEKSHAFIIGINDYLNLSPLQTAINDANSLASLLEEEQGYIIHGPLINPTKKEIQDYLCLDIPSIVGKDDRFLFYFAGHGIALDSDEGPNGYLVPADAHSREKKSLISMSLLSEVIGKLPCKHGLIILDCCFSGAFKWTLGYRRLELSLPRILYEERFLRYVDDPAWQVITSAAYNQLAVDIVSNQSLGMRDDETTSNSPFAQALLEGLKGKADLIPNGEGNGLITISELYAYLREAVQSQFKHQTPSLFFLTQHDNGEFIFFHPNHKLNLPPHPKQNPFMGLSSYNESDAHLFYGRDRVSLALKEKIRDCSLLVVTGASGTGKSSVIKAGLIPYLRTKGFEILLIARPGRTPFKSLNQKVDLINEQLKSGNICVLVFDQYEELITQCLDTKEKEEFEAQLASWMRNYTNLKIILSIRADFEPQFEDSPLKLWWNAGRYVVPGFNKSEIREIIIKPAEQTVLFYENDALIHSLEEEVHHASSALPLLSFSLSELYEAYIKSGREDRILKQKDYEKLGGATGALRTRANEIYLKLDLLHQQSMQRLMLRMISLEGGEIVSKRIYSEDLLFVDKKETVRQNFIIEQLVAARLIQKGIEDERVYIEPVHDALVKAWRRLWKWIHELGEEQLLIQKQLAEVAWNYHNDSSKDLVKETSPITPSLLWNNNPWLETVKSQLNRNRNHFNLLETQFIRESWNLRQDIINNLKKERDQAISTVLSFKSLQLYESNASQALRIAEAAYNLCDPPTVESEEAIHRIFHYSGKKGLYQMVFRGHSSFINSIDVTPKGDLILTGSADQTARLWDLQGQELKSLPSENNTIKAVAFLSDHSGFITAGIDQKINFYDPQGNLVKIFEGHLEEINSLDSSPNGKYIVSGSADKKVILWNLNTNTKSILTDHFSDVFSVSFSPDGLFIISGSQDKTARLLDLDGRIICRFTGHQDGILSVCFSPDGQKILTCSIDRTAKLWNLDGRLIQTFSPHPGIVTSGVVLPHEEGIITGSSNGVSIWWNLKGEKIYQFQMHKEKTGIRAIAYHKNSGKLFSVGEDNQAFLWPFPTSTTPTYDHAENIWSVDYSNKHVFKHNLSKEEKQGYLLTGSDDGIARVWTQSGKEILQIPKQKGAIHSVAFDHSGKYMLTGNEAGLACLWDIRGRLIQQFQGHEECIVSVKFSPDDNWVLTVAIDETARLWTIDGQENHVFQYPKAKLFCATFCDSHHTILTGGQDQVNTSLGYKI